MDPVKPVTPAETEAETKRRANLTQAQRDAEGVNNVPTAAEVQRRANLTQAQRDAEDARGYKFSDTDESLHGLYVPTGNDQALVDLINHIANFWRNERNLRAEGNGQVLSEEQIAAAKVAINHIFDSTQFPKNYVSPNKVVHSPAAQQAEADKLANGRKV